MVSVINKVRGALQMPKELRVNPEDAETLVISKIFLVEDVLLRSLIRIVSRTGDSLTYEIGEVNTDDLLRDPYAFNTVSNEKFKTYFKSFSRFKSLKPKELLQVASVKLYYTLPDMFQDLSNEVKDFLQGVTIEKKELYSKTALVLVNLSEKTKKSLIDLTDNGKYSYSLLSSIVDIKIGEETIDAITVMKEIQLSKELPLAHVSNPETFKPLIKVWNCLPKDQLKKFLVSETKTLAGKVALRRPRGLTFKLLGNSGDYLTIFLSKYSPKLSLRCNWKTEDTASFRDIKTYIKPVNSVISQIQTITGKSIKPELNIKYAKILCKIKQSASINSILKAFKAAPSNLTLENSTDSTLNFSRGTVALNLKLVKADNSISLLISGTTQETQLFEILDSIVNILSITEGKTMKVIKESQSAKTLTSKCSGARKPRLLMPGEITKTYSIDTPSGRLGCNDNVKYQYPGYTTKNDICCFAKDQRNKPGFKESVGRKVIFTDENVLSKPVIITDKLLQNGRLGEMPKIISNYFSNDFNKTGVFEGTFLSAISYCLEEDLTRKKIQQNFNEDLAESLDISYSGTLEFIRKEKVLEHTRLLSIVQKIVNKNIIVITDTSVFCDEVVDFEFKEFILLYKNKDNYEPLVKTINYKTLQKIFTKKDIIEFLKIYHASCQINFSPPLIPYSYAKVKEITKDIQGQILNSRGTKAVFISTSSGIIPIIPQPPIYKIKKVSLEESKVDAKKQCAFLNGLNVDAYIPVGQIPNKSGRIEALFLKCKMIVPVKESNAIAKVPVLDDVEYVKNSSFKSKINGAVASQRLKEQQEYQTLRYETNKMLKFNKELRDKISKTKESTSLVYSEKNSVIQKLLKELNLKKYLKKLSLELLNDNEILQGNIRLESLDSMNFVVRPCETILATPEEIAAYFK